MTNKDEAAMNELLHDDFKFTMHKSGNSLSKSDVIKWAMSGDIKQDKTRIVYENSEVGIHHAFLTFDDGNVEAVMAVYKYKDGKIIALFINNTYLGIGVAPVSKEIIFPSLYL